MMRLSVVGGCCPGAYSSRLLLLMVLLMVAASSQQPLFLSSSTLVPRGCAEGGLGCWEGQFCNVNGTTADFYNKTAFCQTCPGPGNIDDCDALGFSKESAEDCRKVCSFVPIGESCSSNTSCFPSLAFCAVNENDEDPETATSTCHVCRTNLTECLTEFTTVETQQRCLRCQFECLYKMDIKVVVTSRTENSSAAAAAAIDKMLETGSTDGMFGTTLNVPNVVVFGSQQKGPTWGRLTDCVIDPSNANAKVCLDVNDAFCLMDIVDFDANAYVQDNVILACEHGGGVGVLVYDSGYPNVTELPHLHVSLGSTQIPVAGISIESAMNLQTLLQNGAASTVFGSTRSQECWSSRRCSDSAPCVGSTDTREFCGSDGRCAVCPTDVETGELDPFRCFFAGDDWPLYDQKDIQSCARDCGSRLRFGSCKFCPKDVTGLEFGVSDESEQCRFCSSWDDVQYPDRAIRLFREDVLCWQMQSFFEMVQVHVDSQNCRLAQMLNYICGCSSGPGYGGANTQTKKAVLAWLPRAMAILSILGSSFIITDVLRLKSRRKLVFNQLMASLSCFDLVGALAYAFTSLPVQSTDYIYGSAGNDATCIAQGFFIQVGTISCYKNVSLAIYYYLVISRGWSEHRVHKIRIWLFSIPVLVGLAFAFAGIPYYDNMILWCNNAAPFWPDIPVAVAIFCATVIMVVVCVHVHLQDNVSARWRQRVSSHLESSRGSVSSSFRSPPRSNQLSSKVKWQAFWYLMAFYVTWPPYLALQYSWASGKAFTNYGLILAAGTMAPLQGFWNFLVYIRPRYLSRRSNSSRVLSSCSTSANQASSSMRRALSGARSAFSGAKANSSSGDSLRKQDSDSCVATPNIRENKESAQEIAPSGLVSPEQKDELVEQANDSTTTAESHTNLAALPAPPTESPTASMNSISTATDMKSTAGQPTIIHWSLADMLRWEPPPTSSASSEFGSMIPIGEAVAQSCIRSHRQPSGTMASSVCQADEVIEDINLDQILRHLSPSGSRPSFSPSSDAKESDEPG